MGKIQSAARLAWFQKVRGKKQSLKNPQNQVTNRYSSLKERGPIWCGERNRPIREQLKLGGDFVDSRKVRLCWGGSGPVNSRSYCNYFAEQNCLLRTKNYTAD